MAYEPAKLHSMAAVFTSRDLTVFASTDTIKMHLAWLAYTTGLAILLAYIDPGEGTSADDCQNNQRTHSVHLISVVSASCLFLHPRWP